MCPSNFMLFYEHTIICDVVPGAFIPTTCLFSSYLHHWSLGNTMPIPHHHLLLLPVQSLISHFNISAALLHGPTQLYKALCWCIYTQSTPHLFFHCPNKTGSFSITQPQSPSVFMVIGEPSNIMWSLTSILVNEPWLLRLSGIRT